jgi:hypothetical protein
MDVGDLLLLCCTLAREMILGNYFRLGATAGGSGCGYCSPGLHRFAWEGAFNKVLQGREERMMGWGWNGINGNDISEFSVGRLGRFLLAVGGNFFSQLMGEWGNG